MENQRIGSVCATTYQAYLLDYHPAASIERLEEAQKSLRELGRK